LAPGLRGGPEQALLWVDDLRKSYRTRKSKGDADDGVVRALGGVSLDVRRGEVFGVVGESGSGKSTLARCVLRLTRPDGGRILFDSLDLGTLGARELRRVRRRLQCCFQDPFASLDPRYTVGRLLEEPLVIHGVPKGTRAPQVAEMLELVGLDPEIVSRKPHQFSGGQRQRIALARALILRPDLVVLDEPVSALDVSVQAQILNLLARLRQELQLTYVLIVHDLAVAEYFCDRIAVVYAGMVMELGPGEVLFANPEHPYTLSLLAAAPTPDPAEARTRLRAGSSLDWGAESRPKAGCPFRLRCPVGRERATCAEVVPPLSKRNGDHWVACHYPGELDPEVLQVRRPALATYEEASR
jgi:oligopeptide/dipeptide ABC transporter ATP-binding protein